MAKALKGMPATWKGWPWGGIDKLSIDTQNIAILKDFNFADYLWDKIFIYCGSGG